MTVELITGRGSTDHVGSEDFGAYQAHTFGTGAYVLDGCEAAVVDSNTIRISEGELLLQGRHVRIKGSEDISIQSGTVGRKRKDLICVRYTKDSEGIEDSPIAVIVGTPTDGEASYPSHIEGGILDGDVAADFPLYGVSIDSLAVGEPVLMMERRGSAAEQIAGKADKAHTHAASGITSGTLSVPRGGTGVTSDAAIALKSWPVGSVYLSFDATSPASRFGGTWVQISGRFLRAANDTGAGGSDTHTLTTAQLASHQHPMTGNNFLTQVTNTDAYSAWKYANFDGGSANIWIQHFANTSASGGGQAHNNMPAYQDVYAWRRTA